MKVRHSRTFLAALLATAISLGIAACGSGGTDNSTGGSKGPIKIGNISIIASPVAGFPQVKVAVDAQVKAINDAGGINGRDLQIIVCNDKYDPNEAVNCARKMVQEKVVAVVGSLTGLSTEILPVLEKAGIPYFGNNGSSGEIEVTSPVSYPIQSGLVGLFAGVGRYLADHAGKNVVILQTTNPSSNFGTKMMKLGAEAGGATVQTVPVTDGAPDLTPAAAAAIKLHPDGIGFATLGPEVPKAILALRKLGYTGMMGATSSFLPPATIKAVGKYADGLVSVTNLKPVTDTSNPLIAKFLQQMKAADPNAVADEPALKSWLGVLAFSEAIKGMKTITAKTVKDHLDSFHGTLKFDGVAPDWSGVPSKPPYPDYPRINSADVYASVVGPDGVAVQQGDAFDPLAK